MEFKLHTYDIQKLILALICNDSSVVASDEKARQALIDKLSEMNQMCKLSNDYTLTVMVDSSRRV